MAKKKPKPLPASRAKPAPSSGLPESWISVLGWIGLLNVLLALSPQLMSGYFWDDHTVSAAFGAARENGLSLPGLMLESARSLFEGQGRIFPVGTLSIVPLYFLDRFSYKLCILLFILLNTFLFANLAGRVARSTRLRAAVLILAPLVFQVRRGPDAILGYHCVLQLLFLFTVLSLGRFWDYLETGNRRRLLASVLLAIAALLTYEVSYAFFLFYPALALVHDRGRRGLREAALLTTPFLGATLAMIGTLLAVRWATGMAWFGNNGAYEPAFSPGAAIATLIRHVSAAIPTAFVSLLGLRRDEGSAMSGIRSGEIFDWSELVSGMGAVDWLLAAWLFLSQAGIIFIFASRGASAEKSDLRAPRVLGALLLVLPGALISLSPKYQSRDWIDWGMSYLPVHFSFLGMAALLAVGLYRFSRGSSGAKERRTPLLIAVALVGGLIPVLNYANVNRIVVSSVPHTRYPREIAEAALKKGLMETVPAQSYLIVNTSFAAGYGSAFFRAFHDVPLRRVTTNGFLLGGPIPTDYSGKLYVGSGRERVPLPQSSKKSAWGGVEAYAFQDADNVFYFRNVAYARKTGYAVLGRLRNYKASEQEILAATADPVRVFVQADLAAPAVLLVRWFNPATSAFSAEEQVPESRLKVIRSGKDWRLYELVPNGTGAQADILSLQVIINRLGEKRPQSGF